MKKHSFFNNNSILELLFDTIHNTKISDKSYSVMWFCLQEQILGHKYDLIYDYWSKAHQYLWFNIPEIYREYLEDLITIKNVQEIKDRIKQRERFLEFNYALGGLLMFQANELKKKDFNDSVEIYNLIHKLSKHTSSQPPQFHLIPDDINKLMDGYNLFNRNFTDEFPILQKYPFPNLDHNLYHGGIICYWAKKYFAYLFLNLYTIEEYFIYTKPFDLVQIEDSEENKLDKINKRINSLETLKKDVEELLQEKDILIEIGLPINAKKKFEKNGNTKPLKYLDEYINASEKIRVEIIKNLKVDEKKKYAFYTNTKEIISDAIHRFSILWGQQKEEIKAMEYYFNRFMLMDKMAFSEEQDIGYSNHDKILSQYLANQYSFFCFNIYRQISNISYSLEKKDISDGLERLNIDISKYVIIYFGRNISSYNLDEKYNIKEINNFYGELSETFFIIKTEDLPEVKSTEIKDESNKLIPDTKYIYANIIVLKNEENKVLKDKLSLQYPNEDLDTKVQVSAKFKVEVKIKPNINCVCIKCYQQYFEKGMPNKLEDIKPI